MRVNLTRAAVVGGIAAVVAATALGGSASGDDAQRQGKECPDKALCVYGDNGFNGQLVKIKTEGVSNKLAEQMNNGGSSVINNRNKRAFLYDKKNGEGDKLCISPDATLDALNGFNDLASSSKNTNNNSDCPA